MKGRNIVRIVQVWHTPKCLASWNNFREKKWMEEMCFHLGPIVPIFPYPFLPCKSLLLLLFFVLLNQLFGFTDRLHIYFLPCTINYFILLVSTMLVNLLLIFFHKVLLQTEPLNSNRFHFDKCWFIMSQKIFLLEKSLCLLHS